MNAVKAVKAVKAKILPASEDLSTLRGVWLEERRRRERLANRAFARGQRKREKVCV